MFTSEKEMVHPVLRAAQECFALDESWVAVGECAPETRIPDLLLARLDVDLIEERTSMGLLRPLSRTEVSVMRVLRKDRGTRSENVAARLGIGLPTARRALSALSADGYVERAASEAYARRIPARSIARRIVSMEIKRSDWRSALSQANAHQRFAEEAYVAFDAHYRSRFMKAVASFRVMGVGLLEVHEEEPLWTLLAPARKTRPLDATARVMAGEKLLAALQGLTARPLPETKLRGEMVVTSCRAVFAPASAGSRRSLLHRVAGALPQLATLL